MMNNKIKPLVVTPQPITSESLMGLILRTSEANGYTKPRYILNYAGLSENEVRSIRPPLSKIAPLYGQTEEYLAKFYPDQKVNKKTKKWRIANHSIPALYVNIKAACICPECINESGFIKGLWDIRFASVCVKHKRELIDTCPACHKLLSWHRKGLLQCACGQDLGMVRGEKVTDASVLSISKLIEWKVTDHKHHGQALASDGYPLGPLKKASLATLLGIIERLQTKGKRLTKFPEPLGKGNKLNVLKLGSGMLSNWPHGFYDLLRSLPTENRRIESKNLQQQYRLIYNSFFKSGLPLDEVKFIRKAFAKFGNVVGVDAYIDARLAKHSEIDRRFVGVHGLAGHLKLQLPTILKYVKKGILKPQIRKKLGKNIKIFDLHNLPFKASEGNHLRQRDAAKYLHLSARMLRALKERGVYKIMRLGWGVDGYSELDLVEFKEGLVSKAPCVLEVVPSNQIQLAELFRKKNNFEISVRVLEAILSGKLVPNGRTGNDIPDIVLSRLKLASYLRN